MISKENTYVKIKISKNTYNLIKKLAGIYDVSISRFCCDILSLSILERTTELLEILEKEDKK